MKRKTECNIYIWCHYHAYFSYSASGKNNKKLFTLFTWTKLADTIYDKLYNHCFWNCKNKGKGKNNAFLCPRNVSLFWTSISYFTKLRSLKISFLFLVLFFWSHFSNLQIPVVLTIFLHRIDGLLITSQYDMVISLSGISSGFRIFPDCSEFFRIFPDFSRIFPNFSDFFGFFGFSLNDS